MSSLNAGALSGLPSHLKHAIRHVGDGPDLVMVLSSRPRFELGQASIEQTTLDLADLERSYYLRGAPKTIRALAAFVADNAFRRVCLVGGSKAGFGALMLSRELAAKLPSVMFSAVAFSPQTRIWPRNDNLEFPSYAGLLADAGANPQLMASLERFGDQRRPVSARNLRWLVHYGAENESDAREARSLQGAGIQLVAFPMRSHSTLLPVICSGQDPERIAEIVRGHYGAAGSDKDIAFNMRAANQEQLVRDIRRTLPVPPIGAIILRSFEGLSTERSWRGLMERFVRSLRSA